MNITDINSKKPPVIYAVRIAQHWDGYLEFFIEDVQNDERSMKSVAWALRKMAEAIDPSEVPEHIAAAPAPVHTEAQSGTLSFDDALRIAKGCTDYGGGYRSNDEHFGIYQHGIQTVINALTDAASNGLKDTQVRALHGIGSDAIAKEKAKS